MRYNDSHKAETRRKVVQAASRAVREKGAGGVSVAEVMAGAGLTHGGFYAHFPTKEALVVAALEQAFAESRERFARLAGDLEGPEALRAFVDAYVSMAHRRRRAEGCPVTAFAGEAPLHPPAVRSAFEAGLKGMIARIARWLPTTAPDREALAASLVAEMAGAVTLSRAIADDDLAERLLADCRRSIKARLGAPGGQSQ